MSTQPPLQFLPLSTSISPSFWHSLTSLKLHQLKLSQEAVPIHGYYSRSKQVRDRLKGNELVGIPSGLELDHDSFTESPLAASEVGSNLTHSDRVKLRGYLRNFNTIEEFKQCDKQKLAQEAGEQIWSQITSESGQATLESLNPFLIVTFADLKKYKYYYWACFPALVQKPSWELAPDREWKNVEVPRNLPFENGVLLARPSSENSGGQEYAPIEDAVSFWANTDSASRTLIYSDPSSHPSAPGWTLRNILSYLTLSPRSSHLSRESIRLLLVRDSSALEAAVRIKSSSSEDAGSSDLETERKIPSVVGWEKNAQGSLGPRMADLSPLMDPIRLADQAVDLNLQLMRWRILPELDLDKIKRTKCLVLGAGTLGCYVSRTLMAWGVRKITLLDSSTVSFSNPVRQPLFEFEDSLNGGKPKAQAAAESLKRVYPGVDATGISLAIPMPGHPIPPASLNQVEQDFEKLEHLVENHDVIFLGMDSRESRWLPTVMGAAKSKLVMNVALGFDTFLVMRHGVPSATASNLEAAREPTISGVSPYRGKLGCYYCNDIVAPMDSLSDRTLDQMCTVTRPGLAAIASAIAVELMVSVLQHPLGPLAPSDVPLPSASGSVTSSNNTTDSGGSSDKSVLGEVPHQIRGFLAQFNNLKITGQAYNRCTGCSSTMLDAFKRDGFELVKQACQDAKYLERITGLDKLEEETERMLAEGVDWEEESGQGSDGDDF